MHARVEATGSSSNTALRGGTGAKRLIGEGGMAPWPPLRIVRGRGCIIYSSFIHRTGSEKINKYIRLMKLNNEKELNYKTLTITM